MARKSDAGGQVAQHLVALFTKLPTGAKIAVVVVVVAAGAIGFYLYSRPEQQPTPPPDDLPPGAKTVVVCHWNMENLFDDKDDRRRTVDESYDTWFVEDAEARKAKYAKLAAWLLKQNGGIGPDVIVGNEIESRRAAELLQQELNAGLPEGAVKFNHVAMEELDGGRHIAPCVISRYPLSRAKRLGSRLRILEVHVTANKYDLVLIASHWTSQATQDTDDKDGGRYKYAAVISEAYAAATKANPRVDYLVCGDFNETPGSDVVASAFRLTGDPALVTPDANPPRLFGPLSGKDPFRFATVNYGKPQIFDHVGLSAGMLDGEGWSYVADSVKVPTEGLTRSTAPPYKPWRFGSRTDKVVNRGFADHFPVVVTLKVAP
jgi:hypothetical protein